jgi:drug/metabolite transporter (DMT)-like permease
VLELSTAARVQLVFIYFILACSAALAACGQLMFKTGATGRVGVTSFANVWIAGGLSCYGLGVAFWIYGLSKAPLNIVYPFTALTFVFVYAASIFIIGEPASMRSLLGVAVILAGIYLVVTGA